MMLKLYLRFLLAAAIICYGFCDGKSSNLTGECHQIEREALLEFKSNLTDHSNRLASWRHNDVNCCTWYGVFCDRVTGHVLKLNLSSTLSYYDYLDSNPSNYSYEAYESILFGGEISPSLVKLKHLRYLDLRENMFSGEISPSLVKLKHLRYLDLSLNMFAGIPEFLGSMGSLRYLDCWGLGTKIPPQLGNLSNLEHLSLGTDQLYTENLQWLSGLFSLKFLELYGVKLGSASNWLKDFNTILSLQELHLSSCNFLNQKTSPLLKSNFSSLSVLDLSYNSFEDSSVLSWTFQLQSLTSLNLASSNFQGPIPIEFQNFTALKELDLSQNNFTSSIPNWLYFLDRLEVLNLRDNSLLQGHISDGFGNMTSLSTLDLSATGLQGGIPKSFKNLCNLRSLLLGLVELRQEVNEVFEILHGCASRRLEYLDLTECQLSGHLTNDIGQFKSLVSLQLGYNNINGTLPSSFGGLEKLEEVYVSGNLLVGEVVDLHFMNLTHLTEFYASGNQLKLAVTSDWIPPFQQITNLLLGNWSIGPQFPMWLSSLKFLVQLDLSSCGISGTIPSWFWTFPTHLQYLYLSHNEIEGEFPNNPNTSLSSLEKLYLNNNSFKGPIPFLSSQMYYLDLSYNNFSGSLSDLLCFKTYSQMLYFIVEGNLLEGVIPECWMNWSLLVAIKLSHNKFYGPIPESLGTLTSLALLHIRNNNLFGGIPLSLRNCTSLSVLDLAENQLTGSIPKWMGETLQDLGILNLRGNNFQGQIPKELCHFASLRILDVANNNISGSIPNCINELHAMTAIDPPYGFTFGGNGTTEDALLVTKGREQKYEYTILVFVKLIDLSNNNFVGVIPVEITSLNGLQFLNLSNNHLVGRIPQDIDEMKLLESLDISQNQLVGNIPQSMATLTFLSYLNLSNNNLSGRIPSSTQLQSFNASSYSGNDGLCGAPLTKNCSDNGQVHRENDTEDRTIDWFYVSMALGFVVGLWGVLGPLIFSREWRYKYFHFLDHLGSRLYMCFAKFG